jgi:hypothetical protein
LLDKVYLIQNTFSCTCNLEENYKKPGNILVAVQNSLQEAIACSILLLSKWSIESARLPLHIIALRCLLNISTNYYCLITDVARNIADFGETGRIRLMLGARRAALDSREGHLLGVSPATIVPLPLQLSQEKEEDGLMVSGEGAGGHEM